MIVPIAAIRELAIASSLGVALLIFTNLVLLPVLLSYVGVKAERPVVLRVEETLLSLFRRFAEPPWARASIVFALLVALGAALVGLDLESATWRRRARACGPNRGTTATAHSCRPTMPRAAMY